MPVEEVAEVVDVAQVLPNGVFLLMDLLTHVLGPLLAHDMARQGAAPGLGLDDVDAGLVDADHIDLVEVPVEFGHQQGVVNPTVEAVVLQILLSDQGGDVLAVDIPTFGDDAGTDAGVAPPGGGSEAQVVLQPVKVEDQRTAYRK